MSDMKPAWYKTRWGAAVMAGFVGIGLGAGMAGNKTQVAAPISYATISVTPSPVVETIMATVTETAVATEIVTTTAIATETIAVTETAHPASATTTERQEKAAGNLGNANSQKSVYYSSCKEAKEAGAAPLREGDPGYSSKLDRDGDGIACEK